jgi:hypothetical protein
MKRLTTNLMIAAAAIAAVAGSASAQTLKADIPFTFQVGDAVMAPGTYYVIASQNAGSRHLVFRNADTKASALAQYSMGDVSKAWKSRGTPLVRFECSGARCAIREMWTSPDNVSSYRFRGPKLAADGDTRMATIPLTIVKAD